MQENSRYLLLMGCSERKHQKPGLVPALDLYDGVNYRVIRKARRDGYWPAPQVVIVSAKYGVLDPQTLIERYDQRMTPKRAQALQQQVGTQLDAFLMQRCYDEVFINLGKSYLLALATSQQLSRLGERACYASGGIRSKDEANEGMADPDCQGRGRTERQRVIVYPVFGVVARQDVFPGRALPSLRSAPPGEALRIYRKSRSSRL